MNMDYETNKKWYAIAAAIGVVAVLFLLFGMKPEPAGASFLHTEWQNKGSVEWSGTCEAEVPACGTTSEGTEYGDQKQECKLVGGAGGFPCFVGQKRTVEVSRSCEVVGEVCEEEEPPVEEEEPPVEEEEPPVVVPTEDDDSSNGDGCKVPGKIQAFRADVGVVGDGAVTLKWNPRSNTPKVDISVYSTDRTTSILKFRTDDDGEHVLTGLNSHNWLKIRGKNNCGLGNWTEKIEVAS